MMIREQWKQMKESGPWAAACVRSAQIMGQSPQNIHSKFQAPLGNRFLYKFVLNMVLLHVVELYSEGGGIKTYIWSELNRVRGYFMYNDSLVYILNTALPQCTFLNVLSPTRVIGFKLIALKVCNSSWTQNTDWLSEVLSFIESHLYFIRLKMNRWFVFEMMISHFVSNFTNMRDCSFQD